MKRVLVAGATGYLGSRIAKELSDRPFRCRALVRNAGRLKDLQITPEDVVTAEVTDPNTLQGACDGVDVVISTVGITRQKDGLSYRDVDYQANVNLLQIAVENGVSKFIYVSVLNGPQLRHLKICDAKEAFVDRLRSSGIDYCVVRPNGFFSDMSEFYHMAEKGRVYLFGDGSLRTNPIDGTDLARVCLDAIEGPSQEIDVGGPEILSHDEIALTAFEVLGLKPRVTHIPDWMRRLSLSGMRALASSRVYGPAEFFMTVMAMDMLAPQAGEKTLREYFEELHGRGH